MGAGGPNGTENSRRSPDRPHLPRILRTLERDCRADLALVDYLLELDLPECAERARWAATYMDRKHYDVRGVFGGPTPRYLQMHGRWYWGWYTRSGGGAKTSMDDLFPYPQTAALDDWMRYVTFPEAIAAFLDHFYVPALPEESEVGGWLSVFASGGSP